MAQFVNETNTFSFPKDFFFLNFQCQKINDKKIKNSM